MKASFFKYTTISLLLIMIWMLYVFFSFYFEEPGLFHGIGLFFNYLYGCIFALGIGILTLIARFVISKKRKHLLHKTDFLFIFSGLFNAIIFAIWITTLILGILFPDGESIYYFIGNFLITAIIIYNIYKDFKKKEAR